MTPYLYKKLGTTSRRSLRATNGKYGKPYQYRPRGTLLERLSKETGLSKEDVYNQFMEERLYFLNKDKNFIR